MTAVVTGTFVYMDKKLGDTMGLTVETAPDVFYPTSTTVLLVRATRRILEPNPQTALDLGCGCGVVALALATHMPTGSTVAGSDLSTQAVELTGANAARLNLTVECRAGSLFEPWQGRQFDLVVDDVSGVSDVLAEASGWFPLGVPGDAGRDGTRWISQVLQDAPKYLTPGGRLVFPVLTLSNEERILQCARENFASVEQLDEQWYPLTGSLETLGPLLAELEAEGVITLRRQGSRTLWAAKIFLAQ
jgi:precorrin-6B methylase 2